MNLSPDALRERFAELKPLVDAKLAESAPLREQLSAQWDSLTRKEEEALRQQIVAAEAGLHDMQNELAMIARALGGRTGYTPAVAD